MKLRPREMMRRFCSSTPVGDAPFGILSTPTVLGQA
jgi:hypothetical protein